MQNFTRIGLVQECNFQVRIDEFGSKGWDKYKAELGEEDL